MAPSETTLLLNAARDGDLHAADQLLPHVYAELRRLSQAQLSAERGGVTISATGLVHEAYLRLVGGGEWEDRAHFMAIAARAMRQILIDRARARSTQKRGGRAEHVTLENDLVGADDVGTDLVLAVDAALGRLATRNADLARLVELRFFGGLELAEVAEVLGISRRTASRQWARAKAHLRADLS